MVAGSMYFFKDDSYYLFDGNKLDIEDGYPRLINEKWAFCTENIELYTSGGEHGVITVQHGASQSCILVAGLVLTLLHLQLS